MACGLVGLNIFEMNDAGVGVPNPGGPYDGPNIEGN